MKKSFIIIFMIQFFCFYTAFSKEKGSQTPNNLTDLDDKKEVHPPRKEHKMGDIYIGFRIPVGWGYTFQNNLYQGGNTSIKDQSLYFYGIGLQSEFYLTSYFCFVLTYDIESIRFTRDRSYPNGGGGSSHTSQFYEQWFNNINFSGRFIFGKIFYFQTGPSVLLNYDTNFFESFSGVKSNVNISPGGAFRWQFGVGISSVVGYNKKTGQPIMSVDLGFYAYVPIVGNVIDNTDVDGGGTTVSIKEKPYLFEVSLAATFFV